ncbi:MAG TPA: urease accessory protein UreE [Humisphaera sp.]|jgi:urease accessory protein|nr:urease accessory protein UreE [Humisphaera sp.]
MFCDRIVTRTIDDDAPREADDYLDVEWWELDRRALRKTTRGGKSIRILLPLGSIIHHGDLLSDGEASVLIQACVIPCEVLIIRPRDSVEMGLLALEIGNLHIPAQIVDCTMRVPADGPAEAVAAGLGIPCERQLVRLEPRRCAGMPQVQLSADFRIKNS